MREFHLRIVTPDGICFDGTAQQLTLRTITGEIGILAGHLELVTSLGMGPATVRTNDKIRYAACIGGMLTVSKELVSVVATTFEWAEDIDISRADASRERAQKVLASKDATDLEIKLAQARLKRALVRKSVAGNHF